MREVLISIHPKWCELIALGKKLLEIRKTKPDIEGPFLCFIYQTKKPWFYPLFEKLNIWKWAVVEGKGKVVGEFVCDKVEALSEQDLFVGMDEINPSKVEELSCVDLDDLLRYKGFNEVLYGWHITSLKIYDEPISLRKLGLRFVRSRAIIERAPQSWCYVASKKEGELL